MAVQFKEEVARLTGNCPVEEAEQLLTWFLDNPKGRVDLTDCEHLHTAVLQVLMAARPAVEGLPRDEGLRDVVSRVLATGA